MNELERRIRAVLNEDASRAPLVVRMPERVRPRVRRRQAATIVIASLAAVAVIAGSVFAFRGLEWDRTAPDPRPASETRAVFERTATIGGLSVTSPSDWYLIDYWGDWDPDAVSLESNAIPLIELTNFDPGVSTPVCDIAASGSTRLPANGVAILVKVGDDGRGVDDLCGGQVEESSVGTVGSVPYRIVMAVGPEVTEDDRSTAEAIWRSLRWDEGGLAYYTREWSPRYVLDGWRDGGSTWLLTALRSGEIVELWLMEFSGNATSGNTVSVSALNAVEGETFGVVTEDAVRVEYHRAGVAAPRVARLIDLPPSLHASYDAYVFVPQPTGGPFEVIAIGSDGDVLGSNLPPLMDSERVGTVRAFGATWSVKVSRAADGYRSSPCVEPVRDRSPAPCTQELGGGVSVQTFGGPNPAVFVTQEVGDVVEAIDVVSDDGTIFHAVMLPSRGGSVVVIALEGGGRGRFVYHLSDGRTDEGRRPEAEVEWPDVGQVIGEGSFPAPDRM